MTFRNETSRQTFNIQREKKKIVKRRKEEKLKSAVNFRKYSQGIGIVSYKNNSFQRQRI